MAFPRHLPRRLALALSCGLLVAPTALAWDPDAHVSIFQAAVALSPAFEKQLPPLQRDALERGVKEADPADAKCLKHRANPKQVALARAAEYYEKIKAAPPGTSTRSYALLVGQFIHYLGDVTTPRLVIKMEDDPKVPLNIHDIVVPRIARPLGDKPFADVLRERAEEALLPVPAVSSLPEVYRLAVNLLLDVFDTFPNAAEARKLAPVPDGLVVASPATVITRGQWGGASFRQMTRLKIANFHLLDWAAYPSTSGNRVKALVYNATDFCVSEVFLHSEGFGTKVKVDMPPGALRFVDFEGPEGLPDDVHGVLMRGDCRAFGMQGIIPARRFVFADLSSGVPLWGHMAEGASIPPLPAANYPATSLPQRELGGLVIESLATIPASSGWSVKIELLNKSEKSVAPVALEFEIRDLGGNLRDTREVVFLPTGLKRGEKRIYEAGLITQVGASQADWLRVIGVRRSIALKTGSVTGGGDKAEPEATPGLWPYTRPNARPPSTKN